LLKPATSPWQNTASDGLTVPHLFWHLCIYMVRSNPKFSPRPGYDFRGGYQPGVFAGSTPDCSWAYRPAFIFPSTAFAMLMAVH